MSNMEEQAREARAEAALTALISRCLLRPSLEFAEEVQRGEVADGRNQHGSREGDEKVVAALGELRAFCEEAAGSAPNDARLMLETDFNRLFVGPGTLLAVPYESFYKTMKDENGRGHLRGPSEQQVAACYALNGFKMPDHFVDFADSIAIELEFLGVMADKEADAFLAGRSRSHSQCGRGVPRKTPYELDWRVRTRRSLGLPQGFLPSNRHHRGADDSAQLKGPTSLPCEIRTAESVAQNAIRNHGRWAAPI